MRLRALAGSFARILISLLALSAGAVIGFQVVLRLLCHRKPMAMPHQLHTFLEHPVRMAYRSPHEMLNRWGIAAGEVVLDLGCGTGTFTIEAARMVGEGGTVHAIDNQQTLLARAQGRLTSLGLAGRTSFHVASGQLLPLTTESVDLVLLVATMGEFADPLLAIDEIRRVLKPGGRLIASEELIDPGYVSSQTLRRWLADAGFEFSDRSGTPFCYTQLFIRP